MLFILMDAYIQDQLVLTKTKAGICGKEYQISMKELLKLMNLYKGKNTWSYNPEPIEDSDSK